MNPGSEKSLVVWDPLIRTFHWSLGFFFLLAYFLEGDWLSLHSHAGYTVFLLVGFRLAWGIVGFSHARFSDFVTSPVETVAYLRQLYRGRPEPHIGHDPAGAIMIVLLLVSLTVTTLSGMSLFAMEGSGPLADTFVSSWPASVVEEIHEFSADFTLVMVIAHITGVLLTSFLQQENLIKSMITGRKRRRFDSEVRRGKEPRHGNGI